jgi:glycosyltransferase involved in cell wall biosynthesis
MKHILILDLSFAGHHTIYLENIAKAYLNSGHAVTIATLSTHLHHPMLAMLKAEYPSKFSASFVSDSGLIEKARPYIGNLGREVLNWFIFRLKYSEVSANKKVDYVFIPYIDCCTYALGILGSPFSLTRWGGISMQNTLHYESIGFVVKPPKAMIFKKLFFSRLLNNKTLNALFTIDPFFIHYCDARFPRSRNHLNLLKDPAELIGQHTRESARKHIGIPEDAIVILVFGDINIRKGLDALIEGLVSMDVPRLMHIFIVGQQDNTVKDVFCSESFRHLMTQGCIHVINEFVGSNYQQLAFAAADIVWLGYRNHFSMSGVLVLAARARKVVISSDKGMIGLLTRQERLGITVNIDNVGLVKDALIKLSNRRRLIHYQAAISNHFDDYTWENANTSILASTIDA